MKKRAIAIILSLAVALGVLGVLAACQPPNPESKTGRSIDEIKGIFESLNYTVATVSGSGHTQLIAEKDGGKATVYQKAVINHYQTDKAAAAALAEVQADNGDNVFSDGRNLYWGTFNARFAYDNALEFDEVLMADDNINSNLLRAVQIANDTIWKYVSYENWRNSGTINPAIKYDVQTGGRVGAAGYNCYEYTNTLEMLVIALKALKEVKDLPGASSVYADLFEHYEQLVWDASYNTFPYYQGYADVTSSTQTRRWHYILGVPRGNYPYNGGDNRNVSDKINVYDDQMWIIRVMLELYSVLEGEPEKAYTPVEGYFEKDSSNPAVSRRQWYLDYMEYLTEYTWDGWDQSKRSNGEEWGGITWGPGYTSKHTCSNGPFISPLVWLSEIYEGKTDTITYKVRGARNTGPEAVTEQTKLKSEYYLENAVKLYDFNKSAFMDNDYLYSDMIGTTASRTEANGNGGLYTTTAHGNKSGTKHTYNTGSSLSGAVDLYRVTNEERFKTDAANTAVAAFNYNGFVRKNELVEGSESYHLFRQNWTGKADFDSCLFRAWVECSIYGVADTSEYIDALSKTLNYAYNNYYMDGLLPMDHLSGWDFDMSAIDNYDNKDDARVSSLRAFNYSAQFAWIALYEMKE